VVIGFAASQVYNWSTLDLAALNSERDARKMFLERKERVYQKLLGTGAEMITIVWPGGNTEGDLTPEHKKEFWHLYFGDLPSVYEGNDWNTVDRSVKLLRAVIDADKAPNKDGCREYIQPVVELVAQCVAKSLADASRFALSRAGCDEASFDDLISISKCQIRPRDLEGILKQMARRAP
jgi:hypothetical protein